MKISDSQETQKRILNAFAGFGGPFELINRDFYHVTHIEHDIDRANYLREKFQFDTVLTCDSKCIRDKDGKIIIRDSCPGNAYTHIKNNVMNYYFIWASPPCTTHSSIRWANRDKPGFIHVYPDMRLYALIVFLDRARQYEPWVVENVDPYYTPLINPSAKVGKHLIWCNFGLVSKKFPSTNHNENSKDQRDKTNPKIGKYIFDSITNPTLEAFF